LNALLECFESIFEQSNSFSSAAAWLIRRRQSDKFNDAMNHGLQSFEE